MIHLTQNQLKKVEVQYFLEGRFANQVQGFIFATQFLRRSVRLGVRTPDFHSGNTGSIPVRTTKVISQLSDNKMVDFFIL